MKREREGKGRQEGERGREREGEMNKWEERDVSTNFSSFIESHETSLTSLFVDLFQSSHRVLLFSTLCEKSRDSHVTLT